MSESQSITDSSPEETQDAAAAPVSPARKFALLGGLIGAVVIGECLLAYFVTPSPQDVAADIDRQLASRQVEPGDEEIIERPVSENEEGPTTEVDLGEYSVTIHQPSANVTLRVDFHLIGMVMEKDKQTLETLIKDNQHRFRDNIIVEIRGRNENDLNDPGLALIKRRILGTSNDLFGSQILKGVVFSRFTFFKD